MFIILHVQSSLKYLGTNWEFRGKQKRQKIEKFFCVVLTNDKVYVERYNVLATFIVSRFMAKSIFSKSSAILDEIINR